jgi:hypothetical protein
MAPRLQLERTNIMERPIAEFLTNILIDDGFDATVREYSGRGMYGKTTIAIETDATLGDLIPALLRASDDIHDFYENDDKDLIGTMPSIKSDNLGLNRYIYY